METVKSLTEALLGAFESQTFLRKLAMSGADAAALILSQEWEGPLNALLPFEQRLTCDQVLEMALPLLNRLTPPPKEGWMVYAYRVAVSLLYDEADVEHTAKQRDAALCYLNILQVLFDAEREALPFDPQFDFAFCTEEELAHSSTAEEYRQFLVRFRGEYVYEAMRLGREVSPFRTLEHIAGVHHVAMSVMRPYYAAGGCVRRDTTSENLAASPASASPISTITIRISGSPSGALKPSVILRQITPYGIWNWRTCPQSLWRWSMPIFG